jgi:uncharacterized membrane protein YvbJ
MSTCGNCGEALDPRWKFCIVCGTAVTPTQTELIPSVIRLDDALADDEPDDIPPKKKADVAVVLGVVVAIVGVVLIIAVAIVVFGRR